MINAMEWESIYHYAGGLREDSQGRYSESGNADKSVQLMMRDYLTIGTELLAKVWNEHTPDQSLKESFSATEIDLATKKALFLGARIWQAYQQIVQPLLSEGFESSLGFDPLDAQEWSRIIVDSIMRRRYPETREAFGLIYHAGLRDAEACHRLGISYMKAHRYLEAIEACKQAIQIRPDYGEAYCNLGCAYFALARYEEAVSAFKGAIQIGPHDVELYRNLAWAYRMLGRHGEEIEAYKKAIEIRPDYADAHFGLSEAYLLMGEVSLAAKQQETIRRLIEEEKRRRNM
jgi:tetratricopeptide (TPR) repeat protein